MSALVKFLRLAWLWFILCFIAIAGTVLIPALSDFRSVSGASAIVVEWSGLFVAVVVAFIALFHFSLQRNSAVLIIGFTVLCVSSMEAYFYTFIEPQTGSKVGELNSYFLWPIVRFCSAAIFSVCVVSLLWEPRAYRINHEEIIKKNPNSFFSTFVMFGVISLITLGAIKFIHFFDSDYYKSVLDHASSYDTENSVSIVLLAVGSILCFSISCLISYLWFRADKRILNIGLVVSFIPQILIQVYFLADVEGFNQQNYLGSYVLICISYFVIGVSIVCDRHSYSKMRLPEDTVMIDEKASETNADNNIGEEFIKKFEIGRASRPLGIQIPVAAFILATLVAVVVGYGFYFQSKEIEIERESEELRVKSKLVEYLVLQLVEESKNDLKFLSGTSSVQKIISATKNNNEAEYNIWANRMIEIFTQSIQNKNSYKKIHFVKVGDYSQDIVSVYKLLVGNKLQVTKKTLNFNNTSEISNEMEYLKGAVALAAPEVYLSKVEFKPNDYYLNPMFEVSLSVRDVTTGEVFGVIAIHVDFESFIEQLIDDDIVGVNLFISNESGTIIHQPDQNENDLYETGDESSGGQNDKLTNISEIFPEYKKFQKSGVSHQVIEAIPQAVVKNNSVSYFREVYLNGVDSERKISLFMQHQQSITDQHLENFRNKSLVIGLVLALASLLLAVFASFRISLPLRQMAKAVQAYHRNGVMQDLPVDSKDEIGVLARSFKNLLVSLDDVSEAQRFSSREAKETADKLQGIVDSAADAIITINETGMIQSFNLAAEKMFCYEESEIVGQSINILMPVEFAERHDGFLKQYLLTGVSGIIGVGRELYGVKKDGVEFPMHLAISEVLTNSGRFFTGIIRDISIQKNAELERKESLSLLEATLESTDNGIMVVDNNGNLLRANSRFTELWQIPRSFYEEGNEKKLVSHAIHFVEDPEALVSVMRGILDNPKKETSDIIRFKDGRVVERTSQQMRLAGERYGRVWSFRDITLKQQAQTALIEAKTEAENAARYKSEFLASMSHEIRTPMNGVLGMLSLILKGSLEREQRHYAELAKSSAESLLVIVNDILDFSKVEAGRLDLEILEFNIIEMFGELSEAMAHRAQEKGLSLVLDTSGIHTDWVKGDPGRIRQILTNLVGNAIKFTKAGDVIITASTIDTNDGKIEMFCRVSDTGVGIVPEKIDSIFDSFTQVDASTTRMYGGTGLGLAIVKQLCELMNGRVSASSSVGLGSCFEFVITIEPGGKINTVEAVEEQGSIGEHDDKIALDDFNLLVIENNRSVSNVITKQLSSWGATCIELSTIGDAYSFLKLNSDDEEFENFNTIFVDEDCLDNKKEFVKSVRGYKNCSSAKIILLSKIQRISSDDEVIRSGFNAAVAKPITQKEFSFFREVIVSGNHHDFYDQQSYSLTGKLDSFEKNKESSGYNERRKGLKNQLNKKRLLLVEDNYVNQQVALGILEDIGVECDIAGNGLEAMSALAGSPTSAPYDLVLMDCQMPEMDGFEATKNIRAGACDERYCDIPIVAMTANAMKGDRERCIAAGMTDYVSKPIDNKRLKDVIVSILLDKSAQNFYERIHSMESGIQEIEIAGSSQISDSSVASSEVSGESSEHLQIWDKDAALKRVKGKEERLVKLITMFLDDMPERIEIFSKLIESNDYSNASDVAHTIKGVAGNLGANQLMNLASDLEIDGKNNDIEALNQALPILRNQYEDVSKILNEFLTRVMH